MNLWMQIMFIATLGIITVGCGNNNKGSNPIKTTVNSAGQNVAEDGRIVLSSQAENDSLTLPYGCRGCIVSKQKVEEYIENNLSKASAVSNLEFIANGRALFGTIWRASFTVETISGFTYRYVTCETWFFRNTIYLSDCGSDEVVLNFPNHQLSIPLSGPQAKRLGTEAVDPSRRAVVN